MPELVIKFLSYAAFFDVKIVVLHCFIEAVLSRKWSQTVFETFYLKGMIYFIHGVIGKAHMRIRSCYTYRKAHIRLKVLFVVHELFFSKDAQYIL